MLGHPEVEIWSTKRGGGEKERERRKVNERRETRLSTIEGWEREREGEGDGLTVDVGDTVDESSRSENVGVLGEEGDPEERKDEIESTRGGREERGS